MGLLQNVLLRLLILAEFVTRCKPLGSIDPSSLTLIPCHSSVVTLSFLKTAIDVGQSLEYQCQANLNLYDSPALESLATQAVAGRQLRVLSLPIDNSGRLTANALQVRLCEDDYPGWLPLEDLDLLDLAETPYRAIGFSAAEISACLPKVIAFAHAAMAQPNIYLWGGTVGPNYDCSGLMQTAFASVGIWIPRDAYQQEAFAQPVAIEATQPGDLIFFGTSQRATHVGLYLDDGFYIHSSGRDQGRNGVGVDVLSEVGDKVSQTYYRQLRGAGRIVTSYQPQRSR